MGAISALESLADAALSHESEWLPPYVGRMRSVGFLALLTCGLKEQKPPLPEQIAARHGAYVRSRLCANGGFAGRRGTANPYYTDFGLNALHLVGRLDEATALAVAGFLQIQPLVKLGTLDLLAYIDCCDLLVQSTGAQAVAVVRQRAVEHMVGRLDELRRDDGGYANTPAAAHSSTYTTCLVAAALLQLGVAVPDPDWLAQWLKARQQSDGGFVELAPLGRGGTNPTALAIIMLRLLDMLDDVAADGAVGFLRTMLAPNGGFRAHVRAPAADLLSTFAALVALENLDRLGQFPTDAIRRFVVQLEQPGGGFRGGVWDDQSDVEYTYYALGSLALL